MSNRTMKAISDRELMHELSERLDVLHSKADAAYEAGNDKAGDKFWKQATKMARRLEKVSDRHVDLLLG